MKVLVCSGSFTDGCAWYRSVGPWSAIAKQHREVTVEYKHVPSWAEVRSADLLFAQRPAGKEMVAAIRSAKQLGTKVIVDMDDDLFSIPRDNPAYEGYSGLLPGVETAIAAADLVMVSTMELYRRFEKVNQNVAWVPNAMDECLLNLKQQSDSNNIVLWRGTATHNRDVGSVAKELVAVARKFPEYRFAFLGSDPAAWECSELMENPIRITTPMTPPVLYEAMCTLKPKVLIAPLHNTPFNHAKSNIAALEGALAGAACLAPKWEEWVLPGVTHYLNPTEFGEQLERLLSGSLNTKLLAERTWTTIREFAMLSTVNKTRLSLAKALCGLE